MHEKRCTPISLVDQSVAGIGFNVEQAVKINRARVFAHGSKIYVVLVSVRVLMKEECKFQREDGLSIEL
jgi:hypothetical protein